MEGVQRDFIYKIQTMPDSLGQGEKLHQYLLHSRDAMVGRAMSYM